MISWNGCVWKGWYPQLAIAVGKMMNHGIWGKQTQITVSFNNFNKKSLLVSPSAKSHCSRSFSWYKAFLSEQQGIQAKTSMFRGVRPLLTSCFLFPLPDSLFIVALGKLKNRWDKSQTINTTTELTSSFSNVTHPFWPQNQVYLLKSGVQQRDHSSFDMQKNKSGILLGSRMFNHENSWDFGPFPQ